MKYCLTKHALIEDNGEHIANFNLCIPASRAFKILDDLNGAVEIHHIKDQLEYSEDLREELKKDNEILEKEKWRIEEEVEKLDDRLQSIITMLESEYEFKTMQEMAEEIIAICAAKL